MTKVELQMTKEKMTLTEKMEAKTEQLKEKNKNKKPASRKTKIISGVVIGISALIIGGAIGASTESKPEPTKAEAKADVKPVMIEKGGIGAYPTKLEYKPKEYVQANVINVDGVSGEGHARLQGALSETPVKPVADYTTFTLKSSDKGKVLGFTAPEEPGKYQIVVKLKGAYEGELWTTEFTVK
jgi:hypothetical protein